MNRPALRALVGGPPVAVALLVVAAVDPERPGRYPLCPFRSATGLDCPGCGSLRAVHDLLRGEVVEAAGHNAVLALLAPFLVVAGALWVAGRPTPGLFRAPWTGWSVLAVIVTFTVVRNLPVDAVRWFGSG